MTKLPPKPAVALDILQRSTLSVHFDPRKEGVVVPLHLKRQTHLCLDFGYNLVTPIPDLTVDDDGIHGTLTFPPGRTPIRCSVPWTAVWCLSDVDLMGMV